MDLEAIRWELAKRLEGMREACPCWCHSVRNAMLHEPDSCPYCRASSYQPVPLTAEVLIDEGRLRRAIEAEGYRLNYNNGCWNVYFRSGDDPDLAHAYLKAVGVEVS